MNDEIFSRKRRRFNRVRALRSPSESRWLAERIVEELIDRLSFMTVELKNVLVFGDGGDQLRSALPADCRMVRADIIATNETDIVADEDRLPVRDGTFDLIFASGTLESVHDLPGALLLIRRALRPGGLFLGSMIGGGSFGAFRSFVQSVERENAKGGAARFHPQVDVRSAGDLLFRAGFSTPVADMETIDVRYSSIEKLAGDLRATGIGHALPQVQPLAKSVGQRILSPQGVEERIYPLFLTGWAPVADEKRPAGPVKGFG